MRKYIPVYSVFLKPEITKNYLHKTSNNAKKIPDYFWKYIYY